MADITIIPLRGNNQSYTDYLSVLNSQLGLLQAAYQQKLNEYAANRVRYNDFASAPHPDWNFIQTVIDGDAHAIEAARDRYLAAITGLKSIIVNVKAASDLEKEAAAAQVATQNANAAVIQSQSTLTPDQIFQLGMQGIGSQQLADQQAAVNKAKQEEEAKAKAEKESIGKNTKWYIIAGIVVVVIVSVVVYLKTQK